jgi:hypothetical protein
VDFLNFNSFYTFFIIFFFFLEKIDMDMKKIVDAKIFNNIKELIPLIVNKALFLFKVKYHYHHLYS